ncbi:MAG: VanZ family protein [Candidatus Kapaibacteriota bacterium]|jgi:VanZ family protein
MILEKIANLKKLLFIPIILYSLFIIYLSNLESVPYIIKQFEIKDKILHFFGFMAYSFLLIISIYNNELSKYFNTFPNKLKNTFQNIDLSIKYSLIFAVLFAISDEIHQGFVIGRDADIFDLLADILGILAGIYLFKFIVLKLQQKYDRHQNR